MRAFLLSLLLAPALAAQPALTWERVAAEPVDSELAYSVAPDGALLYGGRGFDDGTFAEGTWRLETSSDPSAVWQLIGPRPRSSYTWVLALGADTLLANGNVDAYRSTDGGQTWEQRGEINSNNPKQVLVVPAGPYAGRIVVATGGRNVSFSPDRGDTWESTLNDEPTITDSISVERVAAVVDGPRAGRLVGVGISGITTSDDGGLVWDKDGPEYGYFEQDVQCIAALRGQAPGGTDRIVAVVNDIRVPDDSVRVTVSDDGGDTWERGQGLFPGAFRTCVEAVDLGGGRAVAVMKRGPIWGTEDGGATWTVWSEFLGDPATDRARWAMVDGEGRLIVGHYHGRQPYAQDWRTAERLTPVAAEPTPAASGADLRITPNPSSGAARIALELDTPEAATLRVYDARGRAVHTKASGARGEHAWEVSTAGWAAGVYVVRVEHSGAVSTAQMTVAR